MHAHAVVRPDFGGRGFAVNARQPDHATAAVVCRGNEQQMVTAPHGRADVESPACLVRIGPEYPAVGWVDAHHVIAHGRHKLVLAIQVD